MNRHRPPFTRPRAAVAAYTVAVVFGLALPALGPWTGASLAVVWIPGSLVFARHFRNDPVTTYPRAVLESVIPLALILLFPSRLEIVSAVLVGLGGGAGMGILTRFLFPGTALPGTAGRVPAEFVVRTLYGTAFSALVIRWAQTSVAHRTSSDTTIDWIGATFIHRSTDLSDGALLVGACFLASIVAALFAAIDEEALGVVAAASTLWIIDLVDPARIVDGGAQVIGRVLPGSVLAAILAVVAFWVGGVGVSGAVVGSLLATALFSLSGWIGLGMLALFFTLGTLATRIGGERKRGRGLAEAHGGRRRARNALANVGAAVTCAGLAVATPYPTIFSTAMIAAFAAAAGDTVSSEIGQAYGRRHRLITTLAVVPAGTNGAVSGIGSMAGVIATGIVAAVAWSAGVISPMGAAIVFVAGQAGSVVDSVLGATAETAGRIGNETVNLLCTIAAAAVAASLAYLI